MVQDVARPPFRSANDACPWSPITQPMVLPPPRNAPPLHARWKRQLAISTGHPAFPLDGGCASVRYAASPGLTRIASIQYQDRPVTCVMAVTGNPNFPDFPDFPDFHLHSVCVNC